jgi:hypothetical protein
MLFANCSSIAATRVIPDRDHGKFVEEWIKVFS